MKTAQQPWVRPRHVTERPEPDLDHVRDALREHDERAQEDEQRPEPPPDEAPPEEPDQG